MRWEYGPNTAMNCGRWHLLPLAGEERLQPQQVRCVPRREHRQRAEQAHPRPGRAGLARRAVQSGQLIGAGSGEHVPLAADQLGEHDAATPSRGSDQLRVAARQGGGLLAAITAGGLRAPGQVVLGVLDDGVHGVALRRGRGGQVVVALHLRAVVGVDGGPARCPSTWSCPASTRAWCGSGAGAASASGRAHHIRRWRASHRRVTLRWTGPATAAA